MKRRGFRTLPSNHLNCLRWRRKIKMFDDVPRVPSLLKSPPCDGSFSLHLLIARVYNWSNPLPKKSKKKKEMSIGLGV